MWSTLYPFHVPKVRNFIISSSSSKYNFSHSNKCSSIYIRSQYSHISSLPLSIPPVLGCIWFVSFHFLFRSTSFTKYNLIAVRSLWKRFNYISIAPNSPGLQSFKRYRVFFSISRVLQKDISR